MNNTKQFKLNMPTETYNELQKLAQKDHKTLADVVRKAIQWQLLLEDVRGDGGKVYLQRNEKSDSLVEVLDL